MLRHIHFKPAQFKNAAVRLLKYTHKL